MSRITAGWLLALFAGLVIGNAQAQVPEAPVRPSSYEGATGELQAYCMFDLCLGMSVAQVSSLGAITWNELAQLDGKLTCHSLLGNAAYGSLIVGDKSYGVRFELVNTTGPVEGRYRLNMISLQHPDVSDTVAASLAQRFRDDFGVMRELLAPGMWSGYTDQFLITVGKADIDKSTPTRFMLQANYRKRTEWLIGLPECRARQRKSKPEPRKGEPALDAASTSI